jgi:class 3 adenylate cyclase
VDAPVVRYARSGDTNIAYGVVGEGPFDLVFVPGWVVSALEVAWDGPPRAFFERLASFSRLIVFDKRGTGLSDRVQGVPDLETRMDDVRAVMDAADSSRAAIVGVSEGGPMAVLFAATYPERVAATVLYGTSAYGPPSEERPWRRTREERLAENVEEERRWATDPGFLDELLDGFAPSLAGDEEMLAWWRRWVRVSSSPGASAALGRMNVEMDVSSVLVNVRTPTLVLHRVDERTIHVREGRFLASKIPGAEMVELAGQDHAWFVDPEQPAREIEAFLRAIWDRGEWEAVETERVLATVLFTDIVDSTAKAAELGDRGWRELLSEHHTRVRRQLVRFQGRELDTAGDGFFASFDGPARAIRCACAISDAMQELDLQVRAGLHTGECESIDGKVGGIAVHIGARVAAEAQPHEVLVSQTVKDLVAGSGIEFAERGATELKGIPGPWHLYSVTKT